MALIEWGQLAPQAVIQILFAAGLIWGFTKYLPQRDKEHREKLQEIVDQFTAALKAERALHKAIQGDLHLEIQKIQRDFSTFLGVFVATQTSDPSKAHQLYRELRENGE